MQLQDDELCESFHYSKVDFNKQNNIQLPKPNDRSLDKNSPEKSPTNDKTQRAFEKKTQVSQSYKHRKTIAFVKPS